MKTKWAYLCTTVSATALTVSAVFTASADPSTAPVTHEKSYTGIVVSFDRAEHVLRLKNWTQINKSFVLGENCSYNLQEREGSTDNDLRAGEKVVVNYADVQGVLIADRVIQQPMRFEGMVKLIDRDRHTMVLHHQGVDKHLQLPDDCKIALRDGKTGGIEDILVGNYVTATYETPDGMATARIISQTSIPFEGTLTAIDLGEKTLKAKSAFVSKKFNVAANCAIVINGRTDGRLSDLRPDEKLIIDYDEINGVNLVNRIAPADAQTRHVASAMSPPTAGY